MSDSEKHTSLLQIVLAKRWRQDTQINDAQHNDIQHNDTRNKGLICDARHNNALPL